MIMKNKFQWEAFIKYAPNTIQLLKGNETIVRNVGGNEVDWVVENVVLLSQDPIPKEKMLALLN